MFVKEGRKKTAAKHIYKALLQIKYEYREIPVLTLFEVLEKLKPTFRLRQYVVRRTQIKEYPYVAKESRRYMLALS